jgi:hypothetical protein
MPDKVNQATLLDYTESIYSGPGGFDRYVEDASYSDEFEVLRMIAVHIATEKGEITADDLREYCDAYDIDIRKDKRIFGAVLASLQREGFLRKAGYVPSKVPTSHKRPIAKFVLVRREGR